jgi:amino-acid N-acetyltransferase
MSSIAQIFHMAFVLSLLGCFLIPNSTVGFRVPHRPSFLALEHNSLRRPSSTTTLAAAPSDEFTPLDCPSFVKLVHGSQNDTAQAPLSADDLSINNFGSIFRQCAPYIAMHRGSTMVIHLPSSVFKRSRDVFDAVMDDISILHLLGVRIVIVAGVRKLLDEKIEADGEHLEYYNGMRVSDDKTIRYLKELAGFVRYEIESALARGYRGSGSSGQGGISVVSGNFFYSAKPLGVRDGIDFKYTGEVRRVEVDNFESRLTAGDVVLLTSLGHSQSGEMFNVPSENLAADVAARLKAAKVIFLTAGERMVDSRSGRGIQCLRFSQANAILENYGINPPAIRMNMNGVSDSGESSVENDNIKTMYTNSSGILPSANEVGLEDLSRHDSKDSLRRKGTQKRSKVAPLSQVDKTVYDNAFSGYMYQLERCAYALAGGVKRAHLVPPYRGALLKELYTRDGEGVLISRDIYEGIRRAHEGDVPAVEDLIEPLVNEGNTYKQITAC